MTIKINEHDGSINKFIGQVIDIFEDFLEAKGIELPNSEKDQDPDAAIIYGCDYGDLYQDIEETITYWSDELMK